MSLSENNPEQTAKQANIGRIVKPQFKHRETGYVSACLRDPRNLSLLFHRKPG